MKRKIAALLICVLAVSILGGCGSSAETKGGNAAGNTGENNTEVSSESTSEGDDGGIFGSIGKKESGTLSDYLATEKAICYMVDAVDKAETPDKLLFFQDGTLTILPGSAFDLTMGDFSKMTDEEIWAAYETARETYQAEYIAQKEETIAARVEEEISNGQYVIEDYQERISFLEEVKGQTYNMAETEYTEEMEYAKEMAYMAMDFLWGCLESQEYELAYTEEDVNNLDNGDGIITFPEEMVASAIEYYRSEIENLQAAQDASAFTRKGPFFDIPFTFIVITDASGNHVQEEKLVYPTSEDRIDGEIPDKFYEYIKFPMVEGADRQIYDTTYHCMAVGSEDVLCTRASIYLDTVDSENVLIDPTDEEIQALYEAEVMARYQ